MLRLVDNTLTALKEPLPKKEELLLFCDLLFKIGVDVIELTPRILEQMNGDLGSGAYMLYVECSKDVDQYPGFEFYVCPSLEEREGVIREVTIHNIEEIVQLRTKNVKQAYRFLGFEDMLQNDFEEIISEIKIKFSNLAPKGRLNFAPENTYGCASAIAVQWVIRGGTMITTSFAGFHNNAATEEVLLSLRLILKHKTRQDLSDLPKLTEIYERWMQQSLPNKKSILGRSIFQVESGIHADGIKKNPANYEAFDPSVVGRKREIVIGKHSGKKSLFLKLEELDIRCSKDVDFDKLLYEVKEYAILHKRSLSDEEFVRIIFEVTEHEEQEIYC